MTRTERSTDVVSFVAACSHEGDLPRDFVAFWREGNSVQSYSSIDEDVLAGGEFDLFAHLQVILYLLLANPDPEVRKRKAKETIRLLLDIGHEETLKATIRANKAKFELDQTRAQLLGVLGARVAMEQAQAEEDGDPNWEPLELTRSELPHWVENITPK